MLMTGCASDEEAVPLPTAKSSPPASPKLLSKAEAVKRSYIAFIEILDRADSLPASTRSQQLSLHMANPQLAKVIDRINEMKRENIASYGKAIAHIRSIQVDGMDAILRDCQDSSGVGIMNVLTGEKMNRGLKRESLTAYLSRGPDGRWRVAKMVSHGEEC